MIKLLRVKLPALIIILLVLLNLPGGPALLARGEMAETSIESDVFSAFAQEEFVPVIASLTGSPYAAPPGQPLCCEEHTVVVADLLRGKNMAGLARVEELLDEGIKQGNITDFHTLWIINALAVRVNQKGLRQLAGLTQVEKIRLDRRHPLPTPCMTCSVPEETGGPADTNKEAETFPWNLELINAPSAWQQGITGTDVVVAIVDTGVDPQHPALQGKYRGDLPGHSHATSWFDVNTPETGGPGEPGDAYGHGTHMAGIILGGNPEEPLGVAPGARWIGVNIFSNGYTWDSHIARAFQWLLAPGGDPANAPHIINCSWASRPEYMDDYLHWEILHNMEQAGIFVVFAAGNNGQEGPGSPASYPHAFCAGALKKEGDLILAADFSSRGPVSWGGMDFVKPEITAPGANIRSAWLEGGYVALDGTSIAAAHVSGSAALLLQARPGISPADMGYILKQSAGWDPSWNNLGTKPNGTYGYGLLDITAAVAFKPFAPAETIFYDGAEEGIINWKTTQDDPWKITREKVPAGAFSFADSPWDAYPNNTSSWLALSRPISLHGYHEPVLDFVHFYDLARGENKEDDYAAVEISADGQNWVRLYHFIGNSGGSFQYSTFPLNLPIGKNNLFLRFRLQSQGNGPGVGWYIDEIRIRARPCPLEELETLQIILERNKIGLDDEVNIKAEALFGGNHTRPVASERISWSSSDPAVARVEGGKVKAVAPGRAEIHGEFAGRTARCPIEVIEVPPPLAAPLPGPYINGVNVELQNIIPGVQIYYTLDGREPDGQSNLYTEPLTITSDCVIKARPYLEGIPGKTAVFAYKIEEGAVVSGSLHLLHRPFNQAAIDACIVCLKQGNRYDLVFTDREGNFSAELPLGRYCLVAKQPGHLIGIKTFEITGRDNLVLPPLPLLAGDVNDDNYIDLSDLALFSLAKGTAPGEPHWDPRADFNGDGRVDSTDLAILARNYGKIGGSIPRLVKMRENI